MLGSKVFGAEIELVDFAEPVGSPARCSSRTDCVVVGLLEIGSELLGPALKSLEVLSQRMQVIMGGGIFLTRGNVYSD